MLDKHPYIPNASSVISDMLKTVGVKNIDELFSDMPRSDFNGGGMPQQPMDELSLVREVTGVLSKNQIYRSKCFMGGGPWPHYVPSVIRHIISRGEFLTSYTPYQPEISQGILQALFEFQSLVCELYDMEVANASMYDLPTAIGEAALLSTRVTGRKIFIIPSSLPWERKSVIRNYTEPQGINVREIPYSSDDGTLIVEDLRKAVDEGVSGVYVESPSFFGTMQRDLEEIVDIAHQAGSLAVVGADPISVGIFKAPGEGGADIVVGDGQPMGIPLGFGGNCLGIMACREDQKIIRQLPGRIVGLTKTKDGNRDGFVLALSTREQHIRRERATSNICTNESLLAVAATIYLALMGRNGLEKVAKAILSRSAYARKRLEEVGLEARFDGISFRDFVTEVDNPTRVNRELARRGFSGGRSLEKDFPELKGGLLFATTEVHSYEDINGFMDALGKAAGGR